MSRARACAAWFRGTGVVKPLCGFCGGHHYSDEPHPSEAVREALTKLWAGPEPGRGFGVGHEPAAVSPVTETPPRVTEKAVVTESPLPEAAVLPKRGRPKKAGALSRAEIQRAYRERKES